MSARAAVLLLAGVLPWAPPTPAHADAPPEPCRISVEADPSEAVVGQQIIYRVRIVRRDDVARMDWIHPPTFPDFRAEWLPGQPERESFSLGQSRFVVRQEERAIFPMRAGLLEIPGARLLCQVAEAGTGQRQRSVENPDGIVDVPALRVPVKPLPERGRPPAFSGVIGALRVTTLAEPSRIALGESVRVSVLVRGAANLWNLDPPFGADADFGSAEIFRRPPALEVEAGDRLQVRRIFHFAVIPHEPGTLVIPRVEIPFYDPSRGAYALARAAPVPIEVVPGPAKTRTRRAGAQGTAVAEQADRERGRWLVMALGALATAVTLGAAVVGWRSRKPSWGRWRHVERSRVRADAARSAGDSRAEATALCAALRGALSIVAPDLDERDASTLRQPREPGVDDPDLANAAAQLGKLDRVRFSDESAGVPRDEVAELLARLRRRSSFKPGRLRPGSGLRVY